ncbi:MAG: phosphoglycerate dehydrogenase [Candidatus Hydrogenedentes bacterium]|nr:phosphoglycerate dehydrogenase [Candidatus Hydrogenedentota bacterium]
MARILVLDGLSEEGVAILRDAGFEVDVKPPQKPDELAALIGAYDGLVVRSATKVTAAAFENVGHLKVIGRAGVGTDNIDKDAATKKGVVVMNTPGGNTISTCEHAFALLFALCRNIPAADASMHAGRWDRKKFMGAEVYGKTLGIVGLGRIGSAVAKRAQSFEMKVIAHDPIMTKIKADALGVELVSFDELIERSDFITIHAPKSDKTNNMFRIEHLERMKPSCRIVNCARGGIVNEADLAQALKDIVLTPHLAASTDEAQLTVAVDIARPIVDYLESGTIVNAVNVPSLDGETRQALAPMLYLAERLGRFQSSFTKGHPTKLDIEYSGDLGVADTYAISASIMTGFLSPLVETVNMVSAPPLMESYGIATSETRSARAPDYAFEIGVTVTTTKETHRVAGTLFSKHDPRICSIDGMRVDAKPEGWMLVCMNEDKPLIIGRVGTIIGEAGINIANLMLGRDAQGGRALTVLNLDAPLDDALMDRIRQVPHVTEVRLVAL